jgi:hypothetical protein
MKLRVKNICALTAVTIGVGAANWVQAQTTSADGRNLIVQKAVAPSNASSAQRLALVIGNAAYKEAPLLNPVNDARAIAQALREAGFTVILRENADHRSMSAALREFGDRLRAGGTGLFYYAGHGMQIKGRNFLIPVGANVDREDEVAYSALDAQAVLDKMEFAGNSANIMILDACRNNPFTRSTRSGQAGLAQMDAPVGTLVAFATSPGAVASDGAGQNGLYTQYLLEAMRKEGSKVEDVFKQVRANVRRDSQGKQVPWEATSLEGDFYFRGGPVRASAQAPADPEQALWDAVKNSKEPIELRVYLNRHPQGRFAAQARQQLTALQASAAAPTPTQVPAPAPAPSVAANTPARPSPATQANNIPVAIPSKENDLQEAVDKRTQELIAQLSSSSPVPSAPPANRPAAAMNSAGYSVGDRWRYQVVDKYKQEVVRNWSWRIESFRNAGQIVVNDGSTIMSPDGLVVLNSLSATGTKFAYASRGWPRLPRVWAVGHEERFEDIRTYKQTDGQQGDQKMNLKLKVLAQEKIRVPAGEFDAYKYEITGFVGDWNVKETLWGTPGISGWVAAEVQWRNRAGQLGEFMRHELTSYSVRSAANTVSQR